MQWIIFYGDVESEWVENLNSVMDGNKVITQQNGVLKSVSCYQPRKRPGSWSLGCSESHEFAWHEEPTDQQIHGSGGQGRLATTMSPVFLSCLSLPVFFCLMVLESLLWLLASVYSLNHHLCACLMHCAAIQGFLFCIAMFTATGTVFSVYFIWLCLSGCFYG